MKPPLSLPSLKRRMNCRAGHHNEKGVDGERSPNPSLITFVGEGRRRNVFAKRLVQRSGSLDSDYSSSKGGGKILGRGFLTLSTDR